MEVTPGRAPYTEDEEYTPLRKPKSATTTPTHSSGPRSSGSNSLTTGDVTYGRTASPSKLSPYAKEFVPRFRSGSNNALSAQERAERHQQMYNQQNYQQYQQASHSHRNCNGYQQNHNSQQKQHFSPGAQITSLAGSVQERLKIGGGASGSGSSSNTPYSGKKNTANNYYHQQHQQFHQQHNSRNNKHNQFQHHSVQGHGRYQQSYNNSNESNNITNDVECVALKYLETVIQCLNQNPGQFDAIATRFITIFDGMENNQYVLSNAMEDIFNQSIENPNFRYMGAKLYNLLHMLNLKKDSLFHTLLKCKLDYHQTEVVQYMRKNDEQKVRETALFLAELYMQLRGDDTRIHLIAENIVYSLKQLLGKVSPENVRCICLTLKLAGYDLTADCPKDMNDIIVQLDVININSPGKYPLAANVIALQKNNWGRKVNTPTAEAEAAAEAATKTPEPLRMSDEPIFYGPDGHELTAEEEDFLSDGASALPGGDSIEEDGDETADLDVDFDPEMDEETERAYKEFCKQNTGT